MNPDRERELLAKLAVAERKAEEEKHKAEVSQSYAEVYRKFSAEGTQSDFEDIPQVNQDIVLNIWNYVLNNMGFFENSKNEKKNVHPLIFMVLLSILEKFNLFKIKFHQESQLKNPPLYPDFTLTLSTISEPGWGDCLSFVECKGTNVSSSEGGGQAISYLSQMLLKDDNDIINNLKMIVSIQTNGNTIQFFAYKKEANGMIKQYFSSLLNLFDEERVIGTPSRGFELLCRFLVFLNQSPISANGLYIDGHWHYIVKTYRNCSSIVIGEINLKENEEEEEARCVVKYSVGNKQPDMFLILREAMMYNVINNLAVGTNFKTLKLSSKSNFDRLIFRDVGKGDLGSWTNEILYKNEEFDDEAKFKKIVKCFIKVFDQVKELHNIGYTHCDLRPANILIVEGDEPILIDFVTLTKSGSSSSCIHGTTIYMADELLRIKPPYEYKRKFDLESLFYSFLDCSDIHYTKSFLKNIIIESTNTDIRVLSDEQIADERKSCLEHLKTSEESVHFPNHKFVNLFFKLFEKLHEFPIEVEIENYNEFRDILLSFLQ